MPIGRNDSLLMLDSFSACRLLDTRAEGAQIEPICLLL